MTKKASPGKTARPEEILTEASATLKKQRPGMSLRAVAAKLEISPSYWSKILRGEKPVPQNLLSKVVKVLAMDAQQIARLQRSILETIESEQLAPATGIRTRTEEKTSPIENYKNLGREDFWLLEEWYFIPILNLFTLTEFDSRPEGIAKRLSLRLDQVTTALRRLEDRGFLRKGAKQAFERTELQVRFPTDRSFTQVRKYHQMMVQKAKAELTKESAAETFDTRLISSVSFAGSSERLREAKLILEEAMYRAANLMADEPVSDELYQLNIQLFPLTIKTPQRK